MGHYLHIYPYPGLGDPFFQPQRRWPQVMKNYFSPQKFTHLLTSTPKIGHKHISTTYYPHPHVNSIDQPLIHHDLLSPNIHTLLTISLQMSISSISHSLTKTHLITQNTPILQLFKNSKTWGIIYTYTPTLGWVTHFSNLSAIGPRSWRIIFHHKNSHTSSLQHLK